MDTEGQDSPDGNSRTPYEDVSPAAKDRDPDESMSRDEIGSQKERLEKDLKTYQEKLLQVGGQNRSVRLSRMITKHSFDLVDLEGFSSRVCSKTSNKALKGGAASQSILLDSAEGEDADKFRGKLRQLSNNLKRIEEETGQQTGFVGFPFLQGHADADFFVRGPLVLFPVSLEQRRRAKGGGWYLNFLDSRPIFNGALIAAVKRRAELRIPEDIQETFDQLIDDVEDTESGDLEGIFLAKIMEWINGIVPLASRNDFGLQKIPSMNKSDIESLGRQRFHLVNYKILGHFPQADNEIYNDYQRLLDSMNSIDGPLAELLGIHNLAESGHGESDPIKLDQIKDEELNTILDSDSSQDEVILESKRSNTVVVRGPPGTGKSQVITNLVSDALTNGKKVLVVCQKRAALDVVHQRLGKVGLDKFAVLLDKEHEDRLKMYQQLYGTIQNLRSHDSGIKSIESVSEQIDVKVGALSELGRALHKPYFGGVTAQMLYSTSRTNYEPRLDLSWIKLDVKWDKLGEYLRRMGGIEPLFKKFEADGNPWKKRVDFSGFGLRKKPEISAVIGSLREILSRSMLAGTRENQAELAEQLDTYLNDPGFLKRRRKSATKRIAELLGAYTTEDGITEEYVKDNLQPVIHGMKFWDGLLGLLDLFTGDGQEEMRELCKDRQKLGLRLDSLEESLADYESMQDYDRRRREADPSIINLLSECKEKLPAEEDWVDAARQEIHLVWIDSIEQENPVLKGDPVEKYGRNKADLEDLLRSKKTVIKDRIMSQIADSIRTVQSNSNEALVWRDFGAELKRKRKVKPVRQLFEKYTTNFFKVAPCWLASPESVSKIFPLEHNLFDLVIVDEASQLAAERALPFMYRAKTVVIAGDEKQLQPFDLFQVREHEDDDDDDEMIDEKSLLDLARVRHDPRQLAWHYRSKYQDLINFSNHAFYNGSLEVAPNVITDPKHPPIRWIPCNGTWDNRKNHVEAKRVLDEIQKLWKDNRGAEAPSIGVITFNDEQRDLIQEQFDKRLDDDEEFREMHTSATEGKRIDDKPFFKNIENVQGDERDIIIFSIGYAKDPEGRFSNHFGSLSMAGGENRLNVAVTRAREEMVIVCSISPTEIKETGKNPGPKRLRQFLEYSRASSKLDENAVKEVLGRINEDMAASADDTGVPESPFEEQVQNALSRRGYAVKAQIGFSGYRIDLAVLHPDDPTRYVLGIECDGASFHSAKSVKERDVMRQKFLEGKGWKIERIWSRNWWRNPEKEITRIISRIDGELAAQPRAA